MKTSLRREEYTALGDFISTSFVRDQASIEAKFPKLDTAFLTAFTSKLNFVKRLESSLVKAEEKKTVTAQLYELSSALNDELTVLSSYAADAGMSTGAIRALKRDLHNRNIEGAVLNIEAVKQYIINNLTVFVEEGMREDFTQTLDDYSIKLAAKNTLQNDYMNALKQLTEINSKHYDELYGFIIKIANKGKLVFKDSIIREEYSIRKTITRMRAPKHHTPDKDVA